MKQLGPIKYKRLKQTHPSLDLFHVETWHALYRGGHELLDNPKVMAHVFPKHAAEGDDSYKERKARASYENVFAQVVNQVVAGLAQDPIHFEPAKADEAKAKAVASAAATEAELDEFWKRLQLDATPPMDDGPAKTFDQIVRAAVCEALVARYAWVLCDMPVAPPIAPSSALEQERTGVLDAYPVLYRADQVTDWYEKDATFMWVRCYGCEQPAADPTASRDVTLHHWTIWTAEGWFRYELELDREGKSKGQYVTDETDIPLASFGPHTFGRVPWVRFDAADPDEPNLHIGDLVESQVRSFFNQQCGEIYQRLRHMFQQLYEFLGKELPGVDEPISDAQSDPNRAKKTRRGPDVIQERGREDDAKFVSPDMSGAAVNQQGVSDAREGILRSTGQMALAQDTSGAMLRRSGDSKRQDKIETLVLLGSAGKRALAFARAIVAMLALGRRDANAPSSRGYESFDVDDVDDVVGRAAIVSSLGIKSATFQQEHDYRVAIEVLGDDVPPEIRDNIRKELTEAITQDAIMNPPMPLGLGDGGGGFGGDGGGA